MKIKSNSKIEHLINLTNSSYHSITSCYRYIYWKSKACEIIIAQFMFKRSYITKKTTVIQKDTVFKAAAASSKKKAASSKKF